MVSGQWSVVSEIRLAALLTTDHSQLRKKRAAPCEAALSISPLATQALENLLSLELY